MSKKLFFSLDTKRYINLTCFPHIKFIDLAFAYTQFIYQVGGFSGIYVTQCCIISKVVGTYCDVSAS